MDIKKPIAENKILIAILSLTFIVRLIPVFLSPVLPGLDVFYHKDVVSLFAAGQFGLADVFSISRISAGGYPFVFHWLASFFAVAGISLETLFRLIPAVLSVIGVFLFYLFSREFLEKRTALLAAFFMSTAPIVVLRTSQAMPELLALVFLFSALYLLARLHREFSLIPLVLLGVISFLYFLTHRSVLFLFILLALSLVTIFRKQMKLKIIGPLVLLGAAGGYYFGLFSLLFEQLSRMPWEPVSAKGYLLSVGLMLLPALAGIVIAYNRGSESDQFLLAWAALFALIGTMSFRFRDPFMMFPLAIMAASGIYEYAEPHFRKNFRKIFAVFVILILAQAAGVAAFAVPRPSAEEFAALSWISENTPENSTVLTWSDEGYWVIGIADRKDAVMWNRLYEGLYGKQPSVAETEQTYKAVKRMFRSFNTTRSCELMQEYGVSHVYVTWRMLEEREALEFGLLEYINTSSKFEKLYQAGNNTVYKINVK